MRLIDADRLIGILNDWALQESPEPKDLTKLVTKYEMQETVYKVLNEVMNTIKHAPTVERTYRSDATEGDYTTTQGERQC